MLNARSIQEAYLYVEVQPCEACLNDVATPPHALHERGGQLIARFAGTCERCGRDRSFEFVLPAGGPAPGFGGDQPSALIDPGVFVWASDRAAARVPVNPGVVGDGVAAAQDLRYAIEALREVAKFIPAGAHQVPADSCRTELGRAVFSAEPHRFTAADIVERIGGYEAALDDLERRPARSC